jgi:hypothetical protein
MGAAKRAVTRFEMHCELKVDRVPKAHGRPEVSGDTVRNALRAEGRPSAEGTRAA